jgi:hypothetical protein
MIKRLSAIAAGAIVAWLVWEVIRWAVIGYAATH